MLLLLKKLGVKCQLPDAVCNVLKATGVIPSTTSKKENKNKQNRAYAIQQITFSEYRASLSAGSGSELSANISVTEAGELVEVVKQIWNGWV